MESLDSSFRAQQLSECTNKLLASGSSRGQERGSGVIGGWVGCSLGEKKAAQEEIVEKEKAILLEREDCERVRWAVNDVWLK